MKNPIVGSLAVALLISGVALAADLQSGPQPGKGVAAFHPLNVTGSMAGKKHCLV